MIYFTADEHYWHENIIKYCNRPFKDALDMNEQLIANHNAVVGSTDHVYHLGDFSWRKNFAETAELIQRLNGFHYFIRGSHDRWLNGVELRPYSSIQANGKCTIIEYLGPVWEGVLDNRHVFLSHYPHISWPKSYHGSLHLHGHTHGKVPAGKNRYDVGVDVNDFRPISINQVVNYLSNNGLWLKGVGL